MQYSLKSNISAKNYQYRLMCVEVIVCYISVVFLRHSVVLFCAYVHIFSNNLIMRADACAIQPQKLLFSATLSHDPEKLHQLRLFQPLLFTSVVKRRQSDVVPSKSPTRRSKSTAINNNLLTHYFVN